MHPRNQGAAFSGSGSRRTGGRWNSKGIRAVYLAESLALATLEVMVNGLPYETLRDYICIPVNIPTGLITSLDLSRLPVNWRDDPPPAELRRIGDEWLRNRNTAALRLPSAVIPVEYNYLLNPDQNDFDQIQIGESTTFEFDSRLTR